MTEISLQKLGENSLPLPNYIVIALEILLATSIGLGLSCVGMNGAAWILGGIAAGALVYWGYQLLNEQLLQPNRNARKTGQMIVGLAIGLSLQNNALDNLSTQLPLFIGLALFLLIAGGVIGIIYAQLEKIDVLTAILATTPGNIGVMVSIAADYSKSTTLVSLIQLMRFTSVILTIPMIANVTVSHPPSVDIIVLIQQLFDISFVKLLLSCLTIAFAALTVYIGGKLKMPMAAFLCAIGVGLLFDLLPLLFSAATQFDFTLPPLFNIAGQMLLGITIGEYWGISPRLKISTVVRSLVPVTLMFIAGGIAAGAIELFTGWDWLTCILVAAPGGSPEMIWIALTLHQDTEIVTTGHIIRLLAINLSLPLLVSIGCYLERRFLGTVVEPYNVGSTQLE